MLSTIFLFLTSPLGKLSMIAVLVIGVLFGAYHAGQENVQDKWDAERAEIKQEYDRLRIASQGITKEAEIKYVDRVKVVTKQGETVTTFVDKVITVVENGKCVIPKNAIALHDAAATNNSPMK